jgi:hypothetical protein
MTLTPPIPLTARELQQVGGAGLKGGAVEAPVAGPTPLASADSDLYADADKGGFYTQPGGRSKEV